MLLRLGVERGRGQLGRRERCPGSYTGMWAEQGARQR
jgi:hypothetical protein